MAMTATAPPLLSFMLGLMLVVFAGTAWFAAIHPRFIWRILQGDAVDVEGEQAAAVFRLIRIGGLGFGAVSLLLLMLADRFH